MHKRQLKQYSDVVTLTESELEMGFAIGKMRRIESLKKGLQNAHGFDARPSMIDIDVYGALAEIAYCKYRNTYWSGPVNNYKDPDAGDSVQVRHSQLNNASLILRENDREDYYYVLVTGEMPTFKICGWIQGADGKRDNFLRAPNNRPPAWFVPQSSLKPFNKKG